MVSGEYVPTDAYRLLGRLRVSGQIRLEAGQADHDGAISFLLARGLAHRSANGAELRITDKGRRAGRITKTAP